MKKPLAYLGILCLFGCASIATQFVKMAEPDDGPRARLRITANMLIKGVPNTDCLTLSAWGKPGAGSIFGGIVGSKGYRGRSLGMPNPEKIDLEDSGELYVTANQPIAIALVPTPETALRCSISGSFVPEDGKDYQIDLKTDSYGSDKSICTMLLREITPQGLIPLPIKDAHCDS